MTYCFEQRDEGEKEWKEMSAKDPREEGFFVIIYSARKPVSP
jgi:hypothetical protein